MFLSLAFKDTLKAATPRPLWSTLPPSLVYLFMATAFIASSYIEVKQNRNASALKTGCNLFPSNWRLCIYKARLEEHRGLLDHAEKTYLKILAHMPHHFVAIREYAFFLKRRGREKEGCLYIRKYDTLFSDNSTLHPLVKGPCKEP